jgi:hypothetical protein
MPRGIAPKSHTNTADFERRYRFNSKPVKNPRLMCRGYTGSTKNIRWPTASPKTFLKDQAQQKTQNEYTDDSTWMHNRIKYHFSGRVGLWLGHVEDDSIKLLIKNLIQRRRRAKYETNDHSLTPFAIAHICKNGLIGIYVWSCLSIGLNDFWLPASWPGIRIREKGRLPDLPSRTIQIYVRGIGPAACWMPEGLKRLMIAWIRRYSIPRPKIKTGVKTIAFVITSGNILSDQNKAAK